VVVVVVVDLPCSSRLCICRTPGLQAILSCKCANSHESDAVLCLSMTRHPGRRPNPQCWYRLVHDAYKKLKGQKPINLNPKETHEFTSKDAVDRIRAIQQQVPMQCTRDPAGSQCTAGQVYDLLYCCQALLCHCRNSSRVSCQARDY
jgi:hypothetical protein